MSNISLGITSRHSQEPIETNPTQNRGRSRRRRARRQFSAEPRTVRPTRSDGPLPTVKNLQKHVFCSLASRTVRPLSRTVRYWLKSIQNHCCFFEVSRTVRTFSSDSPTPPGGQSAISSRTVRSYYSSHHVSSCIIHIKLHIAQKIMK
jgi:hypothetical protein